MNDSIATCFKSVFRSFFFGAAGAFLCLYASFAIAENCKIYTKDAERLRCMEAIYESANGNNTANGRSSSIKSQRNLGRRRTETTGNTQSEATPKDKSEDVNAVLGNLVGGYVQRDQTQSFIRERKANEQLQSTRLINACATAYCRQSLAPYQEAVDQYRGQRNNPAKAEAEAELRWQFRMHANPP